MLGICQGGTFSVCYSALHPHKVARLITMVTPIDFHTGADMLGHLVRHIGVTGLVGAFGNISGDMLNALFLSLKPYQLTQQKYLRMLEQLESDEALATFMRMEQWIFDSPALAARPAVSSPPSSISTTSWSGASCCWAGTPWTLPGSPCRC